MPITVGEETPFTGGYFGSDGQSDPTDELFTDGWFWGLSDDDQERMEKLLQILWDYKCIFINIDGHLEEVDIRIAGGDSGQTPFFIGGPSPFTGGWFGHDGESDPYDSVFTDGWFGTGAPGSLDDLEMTLARDKPINVENTGHRREVDVRGSSIQNVLLRLESVLIAKKPIFINADGHFKELNILNYQ